MIPFRKRTKQAVTYIALRSGGSARCVSNRDEPVGVVQQPVPAGGGGAGSEPGSGFILIMDQRFTSV